MQAIVSVNGDRFLCDYFLVLHWYNGTVYGESSDTYRTFDNFKTDGSYDWSLEGSNYGRSFLAFDGEKFTPDVYLWTAPGPNDAYGRRTGVYYTTMTRNSGRMRFTPFTRENWKSRMPSGTP